MDASQKNGEKRRKSERRCIACGRRCAMSGLCLMPWPEFASTRPGSADGGKHLAPEDK
ncbi:MAG: hypothetical protein N2506_01505 [Dehalococcoidales bacterium]|nr:hypothetical protein [Dehalococcoidales bacterium]